jgi:hypothetical protein
MSGIMRCAKHGREGDSLLVGQPDLYNFLLDSDRKERQSPRIVASKFELIKVGEDRTGLSPTAKTLNDRYEYRAQLICQDPTFHALKEKLLHLLASGNSPAKINKLLGLEEEVIRRVRHANPDSIKNIKSHISTQLAEATQILTEQLIENAHLIPPEHLGRALQSVYQGHQLYSGGYTARVEHRTIASPEDLQKMFDSLPSLEVEKIEDANADSSPKPV